MLSAFVVAPTRWAARWGWRALTPTERTATTAFYVELGHRMAIEAVPSTYVQFAETFDAYEARHLAPTDAGAALMRLTQGVIVEQLPEILRPVGARVAPQLTTAVVDARLGRCRGLPPAGRAARALARALFTARRVVLRLLPPATEPTFTPGMPVAAYPEGYTVEDLGVRPDDTAP